MNLTSIYSIPFWQDEYANFEEHKEIFLREVKKYKEENPISENFKENIAGYQSPHTLQINSHLSPLFQHICEMSYEATFNLGFIDCDIALTSAWVNVNDSRQCMSIDHIQDDVFSGVFYLKAPEGSGSLVIRNPAINRLWAGKNFTAQKNQFTSENVFISPIEGNIFLFPSYLPHSVLTNDHDDETISISFNVIALPKGSINYRSTP